MVDSNVWVSALDGAEAHSDSSRAFLAALGARRHPIALPEFAEIEVACALSRRLRRAGRGRTLARAALHSPLVTTYPLSSRMIRQTLALGTRRFLRGPDALYAAVAEAVGGEIVSWDLELAQRSGALTPEEWMARRGR